MEKWYDNSDAVLLADKLSNEQCYDKMLCSSYSGVSSMDEFFAKRVEEIVPDTERRIKAITLLRDATSVKRVYRRFNEYLKTVLDAVTGG